MEIDEQTLKNITDISSMKTSIENIEKNTEKTHQALFGNNGIEKRLRKVEIKNAGIALLTAAAFGVKGFFFGK